MKCDKKFIRNLDNFAFVPTFFIKGEQSYKSFTGGLVYIGYLSFIISWSIFQSYVFINEYYTIKSIKDILVRSKIRNFNNNDVLFGVGFYNETNSMKLNDFPGLEITLNTFENITTSLNSFEFSYCDSSLMFSNADWNKLSNDSQKDITTKLKSFYCPENRFNSTLIPNDWTVNYGYFEISIKAKNVTMVNPLLNIFKQIRPKVQLIWSAYILNLNKFSQPFYSTIGSSDSYFLNNSIIKSEIDLHPVIVFDNDVFNNNLNPYKNEINANQDDGATFIVGGEKVITEEIYDRSKELIGDRNLLFKRYRIKLTSNRRELTRYRTSFSTFLSGLTSMSSITLLFLVIIMSEVNQSLAKNHLFKGLFSLNTFKNISRFRDDFMKIIKKEEEIIKDEEFLTFENKVSNNLSFTINNKNHPHNEMLCIYYFIIDESKMNGFSRIFDLSKISNDKSIIENEVLKKNKRVSRDDFILNYRGDDKDNSMNILKRSHVRNYDYLSLDEIYFQNDLLFCCSKSKNEEGAILYQKAHNYLAEFLDVQTLFNYYQELEMLKKILFDHDQKTLFEILSHLKSLHKIFILDERKQGMFNNYDDAEVDKLFKIIKRIHMRKNENDIKILNYFKYLFKN